MITQSVQTLIVKTLAVAIALAVAAATALLLNLTIRHIDGALNTSSHKASTSVQYILPEIEWSSGHPSTSRVTF
jgi:hypothetical protein